MVCIGQRVQGCIDICVANGDRDRIGKYLLSPAFVGELDGITKGGIGQLECIIINFRYEIVGVIT